MELSKINPVQGQTLHSSGTRKQGVTTGPKEVTRLGHERDLAEDIEPDFACSISTLAVLRGACCLSFPTAGA